MGMLRTEDVLVLSELFMVLMSPPMLGSAITSSPAAIARFDQGGATIAADWQIDSGSMPRFRSDCRAVNTRIDGAHRFNPRPSVARATKIEDGHLRTATAR